MSGKYNNPELADKIRKELVDVSYYNDVKYNIESKSRWKFFGDVTEALAQLVTGAAAILAFAAGGFDEKLLSFIAGALSVGSLVLMKLSSYSMKESSERTVQVNKLLDQLGITEIPNIVIDSADMADSNIKAGLTDVTVVDDK